MKSAITLPAIHPPSRAVLTVCLGWSAFALSDASAKWLTQSCGLHVILAANALLGLLVTGGWVLWKRGPRGFITHNLKFHLLRMGMSVCSAWLALTALSRIPLADFYGIVFTAPFIAVGLSALVLREPLDWPRILTALAGFAGVIVLAGPQFAHYSLGIPAAAGLAFLVGAGTIVMRKIGGKEFRGLYSFYPSLGIFAVNAPLALPELEMPPLHDLAVLLFCGTCVQVGYIAYAVGTATARSTAAIAPFHYIQILWGTALGFLLFGNVPGPATVAGAAIIVAAGLWLIRLEKEHRRAARSSR